MKFGSWTSHGDQIDLGLYHNMTKTENLNFYTDNKVYITIQLTISNTKDKTIYRSSVYFTICGKLCLKSLYYTGDDYW
jgi:hypothetical protein